METASPVEERRRVKRRVRLSGGAQRVLMLADGSWDWRAPPPPIGRAETAVVRERGGWGTYSGRMREVRKSLTGGREGRGWPMREEDAVLERVESGTWLRLGSDHLLCWQKEEGERY